VARREGHAGGRRARARGPCGGGSPVHDVAEAAAFGLVEIYPEALRFATAT
jgi:hypothetical protein